MGFKKDFVWGIATAAYQVEGGYNQDGRGLSVWDNFSHTPEIVVDMHNGDTACDSYNRYKEDVALMKKIGVKAYRFSISWSRVLPCGTGKVNEKGLEYYDKLVDELIANGIEPYITLFHWDFPYALYKQGGWLNDKSPEWFAEYTKVVIERLSDRVKFWITQNEPQCYIDLGHSKGQHAPGLQLPWNEVLLAGRNSMLAHGRAVMTIRKYAKQSPIIGYAPCGSVAIPNTNSDEDIEAAVIDMFRPSQKSLFTISMLVDPVILGRYPEGAEEIYGEDLPILTDKQKEIMCQPLDFLGFNNYSGHKVYMNSEGEVCRVKKQVGRAQTAMEWDVMPEGIYWGPRLMSERYNLPFYITENGMANLDWKAQDGKIYDYQRIDFTSRYLANYRKLASEGVDLRGYFHWSLLDNFEWKLGYSRRFGMVYVDFETGERTLKESAYWYNKVISSNGEDLSL
ncbi:beta-glucosidase [Vallitalea longa]|uniref:Beta-glucosidase n=1 Tax=Vallitalea longa TaxID=2936439 RepID=A0A9W5YDI2_9FIRM|nr:GH1 family beta-glucosidase [Vallitalea longa]GKX31497.1 beta-glucosidase [Vallitalea longa]